MTSYIKPNPLLGLGHLSYLTVTTVGARAVMPVWVDRALAISSVMCNLNCVFRSGAAVGMDTTWEQTHKQLGMSHNLEIFLPSDGFNGRHDTGGYNMVITPDELNQALTILTNHNIVKDVRAYPGYIKRLFARNVQQLLGKSFDTPSDLCLYAAPEDTQGVVSGGTRIAVYLARSLNIPCVNIAHDNEWLQLRTILNIENIAANWNGDIKSW